MRIFAAVGPVLALTVVPFHGEVVVAAAGLIIALGTTLHRARPIGA